MFEVVKRLIDVTLALVSLVLLSWLFLAIAAAVRLTSPGPALYWSDRIGAHGRTFRMPKFRTMRTGTPALATHLLPDPRSALTPIGGFLRKTSLDEIPQLLSVLTGHMTLVGPRPALYNQHDLISLRAQYGVDRLVPGMTGWAQIRGRDDLPISQKVSLDREYLENRSILFDIQIMLWTVAHVVRGDGVKH